MDRLNRCVECKQEGLQEAKETEQRTVGGHTFQAELDILVCPSCGETYCSAESLRQFEFQIAAWLAKHGIASGDAFRLMQSVLKLRGVELASLLDVTQETLSRWGKGHRPPDRKAVALLAAMIQDREEGHEKTIQRLRSLQNPPTTDTLVALSLAPSSA